MLGSRNRSKTTLIGLDIGETAVRAAQLRRTGTPHQFEILSLDQWERGDSNSPQPLPPVDEGLRKLFADAGFSRFKGRSVAVSLNPPQVEFHVLELPRAALESGADADQLVHWEIGRLTSHSAEQIETRHWVLPPRAGGPAGAIGVLAQKDVVQSVLDLCRRGGLQCRCVDTGATGLHQFGRLLHPWGDDQVWGILDLGARHTRLVLSLGDVPLLIRHTGEGGVSWTERIAEALQISVDAAEIHKKTHGIAPHTRTESRDSVSTEADEVAVMLFSTLRAELHEMVAEIKKSYEYVLATYPGRKAADLVLVGGGAQLPNLSQFLSGMLGIPVHRCSAYAERSECRLRMGGHGRPSLEESASAIGLALTDAQ